MQSVTVSIIVERPVAEVFAFVTDARNNSLWQSSAGLQQSLQLPEGPIGVGTQVTEFWHFMGVTTTSRSEVTVYDPGRRYTRHLLSGCSPITQGIHLFDPVIHGTRWTTTAVIQANVIFPDEALLVNALRKAMETSLAEAKVLLERRFVDNR